MMQDKTLRSLEFIKLLAHDLRWNLLQALSMGDFRVNELVNYVGESMNLVSYHLKKLRDDGLIVTRRSDADRRDVYYSLNLEQLRNCYFTAGGELHPVLGNGEVNTLNSVKLKADVNILVICTHNSARSQMAEALLRSMGQGHVTVMSAGSYASQVHPLAIETMNNYGLDISKQTSKTLTQFLGETFDYVITVCDHAREVCPVFPGETQNIHWSFPDPAAVKQDDARKQAFLDTAAELRTRISYFLYMVAQQQTYGV